MSQQTEATQHEPTTFTNNQMWPTVTKEKRAAKLSGPVHPLENKWMLTQWRIWRQGPVGGCGNATGISGVGRWVSIVAPGVCEVRDR